MKNEVRNRIENIIAGAMLSDDSGNNESITVFRHYNDLKINEEIPEEKHRYGFFTISGVY